MAEVVTDELVWGESPRWRRGTLWISDTQGSRLVEIDSAGVRVHELDSPVNGTGFLADGQMVAARMTGKRIDRFDGTSWHLHADLGELVGGSLGDLTVLADDTVYVDDVSPIAEPEDGRLIRVAPSGKASVVATDLVFPNGLALLDGGRTLIVAETFARRLTAFTVAGNGDLLDRRVWFDLERELGSEYRPDGIWPAEDGSVWVAATAGEAVVRTNGREVLERIDIDGFAIACCMDDDERFLFVTAATSTDPSMSVREAVPEKKVRSRVERYDREAERRSLEEEGA